MKKDQVSFCKLRNAHGEVVVQALRVGFEPDPYDPEGRLVLKCLEHERELDWRKPPRPVAVRICKKLGKGEVELGPEHANVHVSNIRKFVDKVAFVLSTLELDNLEGTPSTGFSR